MINDTDLSCLFFSLFFQTDACFSVRNRAFIEVNETEPVNSPYQKKNAKETKPEETYLVLISRQFQFVVVGVCQNMTLHKLAFKPLKFKEVKKK